MFKKSVFFVVLLVFVSSCFGSSDNADVPVVKEFYDCGNLTSFDSREGLFKYTNCFAEKFNSCTPVKFSKNLNNSFVNIVVFGENDKGCVVKVYAENNEANKSITCAILKDDFGNLSFGTDSVLGITNLVFYVSQKSELKDSGCVIE